MSLARVAGFDFNFEHHAWELATIASWAAWSLAILLSTATPAPAAIDKTMPTATAAFAIPAAYPRVRDPTTIATIAVINPIGGRIIARTNAAQSSGALPDCRVAGACRSSPKPPGPKAVGESGDAVASAVLVPPAPRPANGNAVAAPGAAAEGADCCATCRVGVGATEAGGAENAAWPASADPTPNCGGATGDAAGGSTSGAVMKLGRGISGGDTGWTDSGCTCAGCAEVGWADKGCNGAGCTDAGWAGAGGTSDPQVGGCCSGACAGGAENAAGAGADAAPHDGGSTAAPHDGACCCWGGSAGFPQAGGAALAGGATGGAALGGATGGATGGWYDGNDGGGAADNSAAEGCWMYP